MTNKPVAPPPDTIDPHAPPEAPAIVCPPEGPSRSEPEYVSPAEPSYTPDSAPMENPTPSD